MVIEGTNRDSMRVPLIPGNVAVNAPKLTMPDWSLRSLSRPVRLAVWVVGGIIAVLVLAWVLLNLALASPRFATPTINWALHIFGNKAAHVGSGKLERPFHNKLTVQDLDWPGRAAAKQIDITFDLFGWLPNRPWTKILAARDGDLKLEAGKFGQKAINPAKWINQIDAENITLHYLRRDGPREVKIISAKGSFAQGNVKAEASSGPSHITFDGLARMGDGSLAGAVTARGDNLKHLADLVGASAPDTPPFNLKGRLNMRGKTWTVSEITGRMGASDLGGLVAVNLAGKKPFLDVDLRSQSLDFKDLGVVFGIPIAAAKAGELNDEQRRAKAAFSRSDRLIPDAHIDFTRLKAVNADIKFDAVKVVNAPAGISSMTLDGVLRDQVLDFKRVLVKTATGNLDARININAQQDPAATHATGKLEHVQIARLVNTQMVRGSLNGAFKLDMTGSGFREAFGSATGEAGVWSNDSQLAKIANEAAGLDVGEVLIQLAKDNSKRHYIRSTCAAGNIAFSKGQAQLSPAVIDNKDSVILASGGGNLKDETLDVRIFAKPKDISFGKLNGDIRVKGTLRHPQISVLDGKTVAQGVFSSLLSSIAGPLSALPFVETGGGKDAPCNSLVAEAKAAAAPHSAATQAAKVAEAKEVAKERPKDQVKQLNAKNAPMPPKDKKEASRGKKPKSVER
jgi:uncharacterized protein involved in outer membrane biogenesis